MQWYVDEFVIIALDKGFCNKIVLKPIYKLNICSGKRAYWTNDWQHNISSYVLLIFKKLYL